MAGTTIVLITGADRGLGLAVVKALCKSTTQYTILLSAKSLADAIQAVKGVREEFLVEEGRIIPYEIDVTVDDSIHRAAQKIDLTYGRLDVLINNAGLCLCWICKINLTLIVLRCSSRLCTRRWASLGTRSMGWLVGRQRCRIASDDDGSGTSSATIVQSSTIVRI